MPLDLKPAFIPPVQISRILNRTPPRGIIEEKMNDNPSNNSNNGGAGYEIEGQTSRQSPSPTLPPGNSYDVFLSFRGEDTRYSFTDHLYRRMVDAGIWVFRDNEELRVGQSIGPELYGAIKASKISIPVISPGYASSRWCLHELVQILECRTTSGQLVLPIFYKVEPSDVRSQKGSFGEAFKLCKEKHDFDSELVQAWENALVEVASLKGWESNKIAGGYEGELVDIVVRHVLGKLRRKRLHVADFLVELEDDVKSVATLLESGSVLGICGMGGVGKTTIAKAVFNDIADSFDGSCFLANVRENAEMGGLVRLQEILLCDVLEGVNFRINYVDEGVNIIKERLGQKKILIVVDDVDHPDQLGKLVGDCRWFGPGSRVIVVTRNKGLLDAYRKNCIYEVEPLDAKHALYLFVRYAFRETSPGEEFESRIPWVVKRIGGLPLALIVLGSFLHGRDLVEWEIAIERLSETHDIRDALKLSYEGLEEEEKAIFLELACFLKGKDVVYVMKVLSARGFNAEIGLKILTQRSLISMHTEKIEMHDLLVFMGKEIAHHNSARNRRKQLHVADFPVMLEHHVNLIASELAGEPMVGLCGIGGIGKTTIAKAVFNLMLYSFDGACFLANVRENPGMSGLARLQEILLCDVLGGINFRINYVDEGVNTIRERLGQKKILIVVDDVDHPDQLRKLVGDYGWFGPGSRVIITTRDEHLLIAHGVKFIHKVLELDDKPALDLFAWHAFRSTRPSEEFRSPIHWVVDYAKGLPLALVVLGSFLRGRSLLQWQSAMNKLKRIPHKDINEVLKISYDGLDEEEKAVFLDIACFFEGRDVEYVKKVLTASGFDVEIGLEILSDRSLVSMHSEKLEMHDLIRLMGREIVRQESVRDPGKRSRLWSSEDVLCVLSNNSGTDSVEGIVAVLPELEEVFPSVDTFNRMRRLRLLALHNVQHSGDPMCFFNELRFLEWPRLSLSVLEFNGGPKNLVDINMFAGKFTQLGMGFKNFKYLTSIDFRNCEELVNIPDFSTIPNLEVLLLCGCKSLVKVDESIGYLSKLVTLDLHCCCNLRAFPSVLHLINLCNFILTDCSNLTMFPHIAKRMICLRELHVEKTGIEELPPSIECLKALQAIYLDGCENFSRLPMSIYKLQHLCILSLNGCSKLEKFPKLEETSCCSKPSASPSFIKLVLKNCNLLEVDKLLTPHCFATLIHLDLSGIPFVSLPVGIEGLSNLEWLGLENCEQLQEIPDLPLSIKEIHARGCKSLESVHLSGLSEEFSMIEHIDFSNCHKMIWFADYPSTKVLKGKSCVDIYLPGSKISRWFDHQNEGSSLSFPVPGPEFLKCEAIALCAIFGLNESSHEADVDMMRTKFYTIFIYVDGECFLIKESLLQPIESDHMLLFFDAQCLLKNRWKVRKHLNESVNFAVSIQIRDASTNVVLREVGVHLVDECLYDLEFSPKTSTVEAESSKKTPKLRQEHYHAHADCSSVSA